MMRTRYKLAATCLAATLSLNSCIDEMQPTAVLSSDQVSALASSQEGLLNGITACMVTYNSWGTSGYYNNDWGYPCQMVFRDIQLADIPAYETNYSYWGSIENNEQTRHLPYYTYNYYYKLISCCNDLISVVDTTSASSLSMQYLGCALTYRALAYLDMARMFEYKATGVPSLDAYADSYKIWGLTIPLVTETTTLDDTKHNPRAAFQDMYRFILSDLDRAEKCLAGFERPSKTLPDLSVVYGMKARTWLELGSRFEQRPEDLTLMTEASSPQACYEKAQAYARKAMAAGAYSCLTQAQWHDKTTGFNTPNQSWMWSMSISQKEQVPDQYWNTFIGTMSNEPDWAMGRGYKAYRCIGSNLYSKMGEGDWRRTSWVSPDDAGKASSANRYETNLKAEDFALLPAYTNLKFRPAQGNLDDYYVGLLGDLPLMRVEEMKFIDIECTARLQGVAAGMSALKEFMNEARYTDDSYDPGTSNELSDFIKEMMVQKRVEFWGEGLCYFDFKRMNLQVRRKDNTNYKDSYKLNSIPGYVAPWMNYFILENEQELNPSIIPNPDSSGAIKTTDEW